MTIIIYTFNEAPIVVEDVGTIEVNGDDVTIWHDSGKEEFNINDIIEAKMISRRES